MTLNLAKKRIAVVGLGLSGLATVRFLLSQGVKPVLMDSRSKPAGLEQFSADKVDGIYLGEFDANRLAQMDIIVLSPGLSPAHPAIRFAVAQGAELIGDVELFARYNTKPVIAITGSNGKSTVTKLVEAMLQHSGINALAAGNIGLPVLDALRQQDTSVYVLELSSFQLDTTYSLHSVASCILNVSADHLDRYQTMSAYSASKQRVYQHTGLAVFNLDDGATLPQQAEHSLGIKLADADYGICQHQGEANGHHQVAQTSGQGALPAVFGGPGFAVVAMRLGMFVGRGLNRPDANERVKLVRRRKPTSGLKFWTTRVTPAPTCQRRLRKT